MSAVPVEVGSQCEHDHSSASGARGAQHGVDEQLALLLFLAEREDLLELVDNQRLEVPLRERVKRVLARCDQKLVAPPGQPSLLLEPGQEAGMHERRLSAA